MSLLLDMSRSSVCMGVLELVDIPAHWGSAMLLHITFCFPSRCQSAPSTDPIPYPPAWVLGWGELVSWPWETLQPKPPPSGEAERRDSPAFHPWGEFSLGWSLQVALSSSPLWFSCVVSFCAAVHKRCKRQPLERDVQVAVRLRTEHWLVTAILSDTECSRAWRWLTRREVLTALSEITHPDEILKKDKKKFSVKEKKKAWCFLVFSCVVVSS